MSTTSDLDGVAELYRRGLPVPRSLPALVRLRAQFSTTPRGTLASHVARRAAELDALDEIARKAAREHHRPQADREKRRKERARDRELKATHLTIFHVAAELGVRPAHAVVLIARHKIDHQVDSIGRVFMTRAALAQLSETAGQAE